MKRIIVPLYLGVMLLVLGNSEVLAGQIFEAGFGARPMGMLGAFSAIADEGTAFYWNPAGLEQIERPELNIGYGALADGNQWRGYINYAYPGTGITLLRTENFLSHCLEDRLVFTQAIALGKYFSLGANIVAISANAGDSPGYAADMGMLIKMPNFKLALVGKDIIGQIGETRILRTYILGMAIGPFLGISIYPQVDFSEALSPGYRLGIEEWINKHLAVRLGYSYAVPLPNQPQHLLSAGIGLSFKYLRFNYAWYGPVGPYRETGQNHWIGLEFPFGKTKKEREQELELREYLSKLHWKEMERQISKQYEEERQQLQDINKSQGLRIKELEEKLTIAETASLALAEKLNQAELELAKVKADAASLNKELEKPVPESGLFNPALKNEIEKTLPGIVQMSESPEGLRLNFSRDTFYARSVQLEPFALRFFNRIISILKVYPEHHLRIYGHTDDIGSAKKNEEVSQACAKAIADYFIKQGISADRLRAKGMASLKPIASNATEEGRKLNRRMEIVISQGR